MIGVFFLFMCEVGSSVSGDWGERWERVGDGEKKMMMMMVCGVENGFGRDDVIGELEEEYFNSVFYCVVGWCYCLMDREERELR